ncbi:MAG: hypothetical protein E3K37_01235 [Candidatus Kuenenia sp.]|nr:hypothetical protein [Candidatus Kuenenia hertensis]
MKKYYFIVLILVLPFIVNMKIYKYKISQSPNIDSGRYFDNGDISIGFSRQKIGASSPSLLLDGYEELSEQQYIDYVKLAEVEKDGIALSLSEKENIAVQLLESKKKQFGEIIEAIPLSVGQFRGRDVYTKKDVQRIAREDIANLFATREDNEDKVGAQLKTVSDLILLLLAYQGKISFAQCNIQGVVDTISADAYINNLYATLWAQKTEIKLEAEQFIAANNLK